MLLYHPAFDIYHCCFRFLRLLKSLPLVPHEVDMLRILDLYLLFPTLLKQVRFPKTALKYKKNISDLESPYENIENPYKLLIQLDPLQKSALRHLASCNIISPEHFLKGKVIRTEVPIPDKLAQKIDGADKKDPNLISLLTGPFFDEEFYGDKGLKARTGLMEYKYDAK